MRFVSPILKKIVYPSLSATGYFSASSRPGVAVLTYHGILPSDYRPIDPAFDGSFITAQAFRQQLKMLKKRYNVISPEEMKICIRDGGDFPPRSVLLTCDDGMMNTLTEMLPILEEERLRCLFFVTAASTRSQRTILWYQDLFLMLLRARSGPFSISSGGIRIGGVLEGVEQRRKVWWQSVARLSQAGAETRQNLLDVGYSYFRLEPSLPFYRSRYPAAERHFCLLTAEELKAVSDNGMTIGAHTLTHPMLSMAPREIAWAEMSESRTRLESLLGQKIWAFAYPFGHPESVDEHILKMARETGFQAAFVNTGGGLGAELTPYALPRIHVSSAMTLAELEAHVSGFYEGLRNGLGRIRRRRPSSPITQTPSEAA